MKILLVSESYPPIMSGVATVVSSYAHALHAHHHSVSVITTNNTYTSCVTKTNGITTYRIKGIKNIIRPDCSTSIPSRKELRAILEKEQPDIIHVHSFATLIIFIRPLAKHMHIPIVATCHGIPPWLTTYIPLPKIMLFPLEYVLWEFLRRYLNTTHHVLTPSLYVKQELIRHGVTTPCSILPMWIKSAKQNVKKIQGTNFVYSPSKTYYCFIGRLNPDKNLAFLFRSWILFQKKHPNAKKRRLLIIGSGTQEAYLKQLASLDQTHSIMFLGKYEEQELSYFYKHCQFFCMPALYETQSIVTLCAIAQGKTAILAHSGALLEIKKRYPKHVLLYNPTSQQDLIRCLKTTVKKLPKPNMRLKHLITALIPLTHPLPIFQKY